MRRIDGKIITKCSHCGEVLVLDSSMKGQKYTCDACDRKFTVKETEDTPVPSSAVQSLGTKQKRSLTSYGRLHPSINVTIGELRELVRSNVEALASAANDERKSSKLSHAIPPIMVWGGPGVGKSAAFRTLAEELGIGFIDVRLAQRDPVDMRGLPVPGDDGVKWLVSSEWPRDVKSRGIILFDELPAADHTLQVAAYEFILDRRLGDLYQVPDGWYIVAAGNRAEDHAASSVMSSALANRFMHLEIKPTANDWLAWAMTHDIHPLVLGFIRYRPKLLFNEDGENLQRGWPSPRSWERVSTMLHLSDISGSRHQLQYVIPGLIGEGTAIEFFAYLNNLAVVAQNEDIRKSLLEGSALSLPNKPDEAYAVCDAIITFISQERQSAVQRQMCANLLALSGVWSNDFCAMLLTGLMKSLRNGKKNLREQPAFSEWVKTHSLEHLSCLK